MNIGNEVGPANDTLRLIDERMSLRRYSPGSIDSEGVDAILRAAMRAPTAGNMMLYSILEIADPAKKDRLAETCGHAFIAEAPLVLLFLADMQRWFDFYAAFDVPAFCEAQGLEFATPKASELLMSCCDALIAAQNSVLAAESLGIGPCYVGDILGHCEEHRDLSGLPQWALPITLVCYGYYPADLPRRRSSRFEREFICFRDTYRRLPKGEFPRMLADIETKFGRILEERNLSLAELTIQGFTLGQAATERRRSVEKLVEIWLR